MGATVRPVFPEEQKKPPSYVDGSYKLTELFRVHPGQLFVLGFLPPLCAAVVCIAVALAFHNAEISNYNWQCGRARFPSLSRIINLPLERAIWQILIFMHIPIRVLELMVGFVQLDRMFNSDANKRAFKVMRYIYFGIGLAELLFLGALSIVGERENTQIHVVLFYAFGLCGIGFFIASTYCHRRSLYYVKPYGRIGYWTKFSCMSGYIGVMPVLVTAFFLYWKKCLTIGYEIFALCEYVGVLFNIGFHGASYFDVKDRLLLSVRIREPLDVQEDIKK